LALGRGLTSRYDALDAQVRALNEEIDDLVRERKSGQMVLEIAGFNHGPA
jgi:hypothetical protein